MIHLKGRIVNKNSQHLKENVYTLIPGVLYFKFLLIMWSTESEEYYGKHRGRLYIVPLKYIT